MDAGPGKGGGGDFFFNIFGLIPVYSLDESRLARAILEPGSHRVGSRWYNDLKPASDFYDALGAVLLPLVDLLPTACTPVEALCSGGGGTQKNSIDRRGLKSKLYHLIASRML